MQCLHPRNPQKKASPTQRQASQPWVGVGLEGKAAFGICEEHGRLGTLDGCFEQSQSLEGPLYEF